MGDRTIGTVSVLQRYLVHREPDGTLIREPAEVLSITEARVLADEHLKDVVAGNGADPSRLRRRDGARSPREQRVAELLSTPEADEGQSRCAARINAALDLLEADLGDARNRRRRLNTIGLWGIAVVYDDEERLILCEPQDDDVEIVHHIVPAP